MRNLPRMESLLSRFPRYTLALLLLVLLNSFSARGEAPSVANAGAVYLARPAISAQVIHTIAAEGTARVVLTLRNAPAIAPPDVFADVRQRARIQAQIAAQQESVLALLAPDAFMPIRRYEMLPALAGVLNREGLEALATSPDVSRIQMDLATTGHLGQSVPALQANVVHATYDLTGAGKRIAVLDTGIDTDHPDLAGAIIAQRCFTDGDCAPHGGDNGLSAEDEHGHGTNVSGIITADGIVSSRGFAPDAEIVAVRVLNELNWGWLSDWVAGLDWILSNQATLQVDAVNMSLGTVALYTGNCDSTWNIVTHSVRQLKEIGVPVFASSGNQGDGLRMGSPACNQDVIAVGAVYDGELGRQPAYGTYKSWFGGNWPDCFDAVTSLGAITCFTNSGEMLDLLAPGMWITSTGIGGGTSTYAGTSQASPTAAAIALLMQQANEDLAPEQIENVLQLSGARVMDVRNGRTIFSINALDAIEALDLVALEPATWLPVVSGR